MKTESISKLLFIWNRMWFTIADEKSKNKIKARRKNDKVEWKDWHQIRKIFIYGIVLVFSERVNTDIAVNSYNWDQNGKNNKTFIIIYNIHISHIWKHDAHTAIGGAAGNDHFTLPLEFCNLWFTCEMVNFNLLWPVFNAVVQFISFPFFSHLFFFFSLLFFCHSTFVHTHTHTEDVEIEKEANHMMLCW